MSKSPKKNLTEADRVKRKEQDRLHLAQLQKEESEEQDRIRLVQLQKEKSEEMEKKAEEKRKQAIFHKMNHLYDSSDSDEGPALTGNLNFAKQNINHNKIQSKFLYMLLCDSE